MNHRTAVDVLLVEDSPTDAAIIRDWLGAKRRLYEFAVSWAESLEEAISLLEQRQFDVMLLDLGLHDSRGLETLHTMIAEPSRVPIIVLTGMNDEEVAIEAVYSGAQDFLVKSEYDENLLRRSIRYSIERHRLQQQRDALNRQLLTVLEDEQQRIARELHDEVGQGLVGVNMMTRSLARKLKEESHAEGRKATLISEGIQDTLDSFRNVLGGLSPVAVDEQGLRVALQRLCDGLQLQCEEVDCQFDCEEGLSVSDNNVATNVYRIAQESITNARKHAQPKRLSLRLFYHGGNLVLQVSDDGPGFDTLQHHNAGMGLRILRHRSELIGANLLIESGPTGTLVQCEVPVAHESTA